jgi:hypothetical protein
LFLLLELKGADMKKSLLITLVILLSASLAFAQGGSIQITSGPTYTSCNFGDSGTIFVYFWHMASPGCTGCEFIMDWSQISGWTFLAANWGTFQQIGTPETGLSLAYGACLSGNISLGSAFYSATGASGTCKYLRLKAHPVPSIPGETHILVTDCTEPFPGYMHATGGEGVVNSNTGCDCDVPAEETSWGQIKALYK